MLENGVYIRIRGVFIIKYYKVLIIALVIVVLVIMGYSQYEDKKMYEEYISVSVITDMQKLVNAIVDSQKIYRNILEEEVITKGDAYFLSRNSGNVMVLYQKYDGLAKRFELINHRDTQNTTAKVAQDISAFFGEMIREESVDSSNLDDVSLKLNHDMKQKVIKLKDLNSLWVSSVKNNVFGLTDKQDNLIFNTQQFREHYGENSLSDKFWVNFVVDIERDTQKFLQDNGLFDIENVLFKSRIKERL